MHEKTHHIGETPNVKTRTIPRKDLLLLDEFLFTQGGIRIYWTEEQDNLVKDNYGKVSIDELIKLVGVETKSQIYNRATTLGIQKKYPRWTEEEKEYLIENYSKLSNFELANYLEKPVENITQQAYRFGLSQSKEWSQEEKEFMFANYPTMDNKEIARILNRKQNLIVDQAYTWGIKKEVRVPKRFSKEKFLENLKAYAEKLGRTPLVTEVFAQEWALQNASLNRYFGGYRNVCKILDLELNMDVFGRRGIHYSINNDVCLSKSEKIVTDFFIMNNIDYEKEVRYCVYSNDERFGRKICDWLINGSVFVEYFGMMEKDFYSVKANEKIRLCDENNLRLISLYDKDLTKLDTIFKEFVQ